MEFPAGVEITSCREFWWSIARGHLKTPLAGTRARSALLRFAGGNVAYAAVIGIAFLSAPASLLISGLVAVYYMFEQTPGEGRASHES